MSVAALERAIREFLDQHNTAARPFGGRNRPTRSWRASHDSRSGLSRRTAAKRFMNH